MTRDPLYSIPDFLNLGVAPLPPRGATAVAPRAGWVLRGTTGDPFPALTRSRQPLLIPFYLLALTAAVQGQAFYGPFKSPLTPNPYQNT